MYTIHANVVKYAVKCKMETLLGHNKTITTTIINVLL